MDRKEALQRLRPTIAFVLPLILVVALAAVLRFREQSRPVAFSVDMPSVIEVAQDQPTVSFEITLRLENRRDQDIDLVAASDCDLFRWFVLDRSGSFVQGQLVDSCGETAVAEILRAESTLVRTTTLTMDARRLEPDRRYRLMLRFWGYEIQERFRVEAREGSSR